MFDDTLNYTAVGFGIAALTVFVALLVTFFRLRRRLFRS